MKIGLIKEGKIPTDNRVALTPQQCKWIIHKYPQIEIIVQASSSRCFKDREYQIAGIPVAEDVSNCDILMGIKEVPVEQLIADKTYLFFSHTQKKQPGNKKLLQEIVRKQIRLIDYEFLTHEDGQRIIGFGFFAGIVGAHNGIMAYGNRKSLYSLERVHKQRSFKDLIHVYFGLKLPNIKVAVTGSGRVAHGIVEVMNLLGIHEVEPDEYLKRRFSYPVFTQLKGSDLYMHQNTKSYSREHFHNHPNEYQNLFLPYAAQTDILMNGVFWKEDIPRLFHKEDIQSSNFIIETIADITDDKNGSVPINCGDSTISDPVYGINKQNFERTAPYLPTSVDVMAVGNLPNELPRDASKYFGEQLIKYVLDELLLPNSSLIDRATFTKQGALTLPYAYLSDYLND